MIEEPFSASKDRYTSGMKYRHINRKDDKGLLLPEISLGLWHNFGGVDPITESRKKILYAFDRGITHFDLANNYGPPYGSAEETFGEIMKKDLRPYRDELIITSKAGHDMWNGPYGDGSSRKYLMASLNQSLKRMNLDYVDIFYSHRYDSSVEPEETAQALVDIVRQGKALYVGISKYPPEVAEIMYNYLRRHDTPCLVYQGKFNIFDRIQEQDGTIDLAYNNGVGYVAFSPLAQGLLSDRYIAGIPADSRVARGGYLKKEQITPEIHEKIEKLNAMAIRRGESLAQMAIAWLLQNKKISSVIVGASSVGQLDNNLKALDSSPLTEEELREIDNISFNGR